MRTECRSGQLQPWVSLTIRWDREYTRQVPNNHDFNLLVTDCVDELRRHQVAFCFTEEQKNEIEKRARFKITSKYQDEMFVLRRIN